MEDFSIGILTYNQEDFIIELLESVKFQIKTYDTDWKVYLYVVDDYSSDKTPAYIDKWLNVNQSIFADVHFTKNKRNRGTVYNHNFLIDSIQTNHFKVIAGDDVISSQNLFECSKVDDNTLKVCSCIILKNNQLTLNRLSLRLSLYNKIYEKRNQKLINSLGVYNWIVTPETCYTKTLYTNCNCYNYNKNYKYMEDIGAWYAMIKNNEDLKIQISKSTPIFWRQSINSISNSRIWSNQNFKRAWLKDAYEFRKTIYPNLRFLSKWHVKNQIKLYKTTKKIPKWLDLARYKFKIIDFIMSLPKNKRIEQEWVNQISKNIEKEQSHYKMIQKKANEFIKEIS